MVAESSASICIIKRTYFLTLYNTQFMVSQFLGGSPRMALQRWRGTRRYSGKAVQINIIYLLQANALSHSRDPPRT